MLEKLKKIFLFDTSSLTSLQDVRAQIIEDNRRFAVQWSAVQFIYGAVSLVISFWKELYGLCRGVYIAAMICATVAFILAKFAARKVPLLVYLAMLFNDAALLVAGTGIAVIRMPYDGRTIMLFIAALVVPALFVNNTLLNILVAVLNIIVSGIVLTSNLPPDLSGWCLTHLVLFSSMGVLLAHFINKSRYERYVFAESNAKLAELQTKFAYYDQLTELQNRRAYSEMIDRLAAKTPDVCCVVAIDINGLKETNDTYGHEAGDELIVGVAQCLRESFAGVDTIYRFGGDEFCVITNAPEEKVRQDLARLTQACADWKGVYIDGISVSYGYASTEEFSGFAAVLKAADQRMYAYKKEYYEISGLDRRKG